MKIEAWRNDFVKKKAPPYHHDTEDSSPEFCGGFSFVITYSFFVMDCLGALRCANNDYFCRNK